MTMWLECGDTRKEHFGFVGGRLDQKQIPTHILVAGATADGSE